MGLGAPGHQALYFRVSFSLTANCFSHRATLPRHEMSKESCWTELACGSRPISSPEQLVYENLSEDSWLGCTSGRIAADRCRVWRRRYGRGHQRGHRAETLADIRSTAQLDYQRRFIDPKLEGDKRQFGNHYGAWNICCDRIDNR